MSVDRARGIQETGKKERQCRRMLKLLQNCTHLTRQQAILKILQAWRHQYVNREIPDVQTGYREGKGARDQIVNILWFFEKAREFQKNTYFCFIDYTKTFDCVNHNKLENSSRDGNIRPSDLPPLKSVCR